MEGINILLNLDMEPLVKVCACSGRNKNKQLSIFWMENYLQ